MDYKKLRLIVEMVDEIDDLMKRIDDTQESPVNISCMKQGLVERRNALLSEIVLPITHDYVD